MQGVFILKEGMINSKKYTKLTFEWKKSIIPVKSQQWRRGNEYQSENL